MNSAQTIEQQEGAVYCPKCGTENTEPPGQCTRCGRDLSGINQPPPSLWQIALWLVLTAVLIPFVLEPAGDWIRLFVAGALRILFGLA